MLFTCDLIKKLIIYLLLFSNQLNMFNINYIKNYVNIVINFICYYLEIFPIISNYLEKFVDSFYNIKNFKARLGIIRTSHGKFAICFYICATKQQ